MPRVEENPSILAPFDVKSWWRRQKRLNFDEPSSRRVVQPIVLQLAHRHVICRPSGFSGCANHFLTMWNDNVFNPRSRFDL